MELYIFDRGLNFIGILDTFFSLRWIRRYHKYGEFELHCSLTPQNLELLKRENVIWKKEDEEAGYIEYINLKQDTEGNEILVVKGKFLTGYFDRRIIWGQEIFNTTVENAMRTTVDKNCINPADLDRIMPGLILGTTKGFIQNINYQVTYKNLLDELEKLSITSGLGYRTIVDIQNQQMIFDIYKGLNRTAGQNINPPAIFSKEFENVLDQEYTDSLNNYKNLALVAGEGEGSARELLTVGQGIGLDRYEIFVDARDLQSKDENNNVIPTADYRKMLEERGNSKLSEFTDIQTFDSRINIRSNLIYKEDFDLGDMVTCTSKKWGITIDTRITEVEEIYEESGFDINVIFGNNIPTLIDKIKQELR